ncbi:MAG: hypothetical protein JW843_12430 [Candidatus Aminicenantes bacterium]|nr:hypothetical protein [Candidatus Aminicenantes bacterium]
MDMNSFREFRPAVLALLFLVFTGGAGPAPTEGRGQAVAAAEATRRLSMKISLKDWELDSAGAIRFGRVSAVRKAEGEILTVHFFSDIFRTISTPGTRPEVFNGDYFLISNFDSPPPNTLGGGVGSFSRAPSAAAAEVRTTTEGRNALVISTLKGEEGFCGAWIHLIDTFGEQETRAFLNTDPFSFLVFWVRSDVPGLEVTLKLADSAWFRRDDAAAVGPVASFLPRGRIETEWQLAVIPLSALPGNLDRRALASLVFEVTTPGSHRIEVKGLALANPGQAPPSAPPPPVTPSRATWVWNTEDVCRSNEQLLMLLDHLTREKIDLVHLSLPYRSGAVVLDDSLLAPLVERLFERGIRTHALFGDKTLVLAENHAFVRKTIDDIISYNGRVPEPARFSGIHVDIEPYLCIGFNSRARGILLKNFISILAEAGGLARSADLTFGADTPPWFDAVNEYSEDVLTTTYGGRTKPVYEHLIDICDQVTLMDYRTTSSGLNGTIAQAAGELAYAAKVGKKVYIGLETAPIDDERLFTFRGAPALRPDALPKAPAYICISGSGPEPTLTLLAAAEAAVFQEELGRGGGGPAAFWWPVFHVPLVSGSSISFIFHGPDKLRRVALETAAELSLYPSFAGIAFHNATYHRKLVSEEESGPTP